MSKTYSAFKRVRVIKNMAIVSLLALISVITSVKVDFSMLNLLDGIPKGAQFVMDIFPPDWSAFQDLVMPALETIILALLATVVGSILSVLFAIAGSNNIAPSWLKAISRTIMAMERALPEIIIILPLIAALGLGYFAGVIALSIGCIGMLGKLFADAIEEIPDSITDSLKMTGASQAQVIWFAVLPEVTNSIINNTIFRFEVNIRLSVLLGAVGAGGIGYELYFAFQMLDYNRMTAAIIIILILVIGSERLSSLLRKYINEGSTAAV